MTESPRLTPAKQAEQAARAEKQATALRENLHRRKQQAREKESRTAQIPKGNEPAA